MRTLKIPAHVEAARTQIVAALTGLSLHDAEWALDTAQYTLHRLQDSVMQGAVFDPSMVKPMKWSETDV